MTYKLGTRDDYVRRIIAVGVSMGIKPRGVVIAIATGLVESNIKVYANRAVPASMKLPYDAIGSDSRSVGIYQQQVVWGNGAWWWGNAEQCMSPEESSRLFFQRLAKRNYNSGDAGAHAQAVQGSAFPDRYAQRMAEAQAIYNRLSGGGASVARYYDSDRSNEFGFGRHRSTANLIGICIHTTESGKSATANAQTADNVTSYQVRSQSGSYNVMVGVDGKRIRQNTDDWQVWATGNKGNDILLHLCFVGNASQSRAEWLAQDKMLRAGASVVKYWASKYNFPLRKVGVNGLPGICGHVDTRAWGSTTHTDPGPNFPYDKLIAYAKGGAQDEGVFMALSDKEQRELLANTRLILDQLGPKLPAWGEASSFGKDANGNERTLRDGIIAKFKEIGGNK